MNFSGLCLLWNIRAASQHMAQQELARGSSTACIRHSSQEKGCFEIQPTSPQWTKENPIHGHWICINYLLRTAIIWYERQGGPSIVSSAAGSCAKSAPTGGEVDSWRHWPWWCLFGQVLHLRDMLGDVQPWLLLPWVSTNGELCLPLCTEHLHAHTPIPCRNTCRTLQTMVFTRPTQPWPRDA